MQIRLSDHFTYKTLIRFTLPSIVMMVFTSIYGVVDGFFVSNFVGKTPFAALNFIYPFLMILASVGFLFGSGGSALIAKTLGEGDRDRANRLLSLFVLTSILTGIVIAVPAFLFLRPIAAWLGAEGQLLDDCVTYGRILLVTLPFTILQFEFQTYFITAEKPQLGLAASLISGCGNMVLDALFMAVFRWGIVGAAAATALSQAIGGVLPLLYFGRPNTSLLRLTGTRFDGKALLKTVTNGSSELMSNLSMSLVSMLYNFQLLRYSGENGVAAYGVLMYLNFFFVAIFIGYSTGVAPVISFHFGAKMHGELRSLRRKSLVIVAVFSVWMVVLAFALASPMAAFFVGYDGGLADMTVRALRISAFSYLFSGIAIFGSSFFTALSDGLTSALISFLRTMVFQVAAILLFPLLWGTDGIWLSLIAAELAAAILTFLFLTTKQKKYHY